MLNEKDIYSHIANGGDPKALHKALEAEIKFAQEKVIKEKAAELKKRDNEQKALKARDAAFKALKDYVALVNATLDDAFIDSALEICKSFKIFTSKDAQTPAWFLDFIQRI
jgi:hypothetical protein